MSLMDHAHDRASDLSHSLAAKRWQSRLLSAKLRDLRRRSGLTQLEVAERAGISDAAVHNYETMRSTPKQGHLEALASVFDVRPESLRLFDFEYIPASALIQLGETYGLEPVSSDARFAYLRPANGFMARFLGEWLERYRGYRDGEMGPDDYERWKDRYSAEFDMAEFPLRYPVVDGQRVSVESWANARFSDSLRRLRKAHGMTQGELAQACSVSKFAIRSYEQKKRLPLDSQLGMIASALGVTKASLTFFDFGSPVQAAHALFQIAHVFGLVPGTVDGVPVLRTARPGLEQVIDQWADELRSVESGTARLDYQSWKDVYDPEASDFRDAYAGRTRYRMQVVERPGVVASTRVVAVSEHDPYDERYDDGFARA